MTNGGSPSPGWYQDPAHRTKVRYWDGRTLLRVSRQAAIGTRKDKLPEDLHAETMPAEQRPPSLYEVPDSDQRRWWNGSKWSTRIPEVLEGFVGHLIVFLESTPTAYRLDAVEEDFMAASRPWSQGGALALFPLQQVIAIYPGLITVKEGGMTDQTECTGSCAIVIGGNQTTSEGPRALVGYSVSM